MYSALTDVFVTPSPRYPCSLPCDASWRHQDSSAGRSEGRADHVFRSRGLLPKDYERGGLQGFVEGSWGWVCLCISARIDSKFLGSFPKIKLSNCVFSSSSYVPILSSVWCDSGDLWALTTVVLYRLRRTVCSLCLNVFSLIHKICYWARFIYYSKKIREFFFLFVMV